MEIGDVVRLVFFDKNSVLHERTLPEKALEVITDPAGK
jgi:hypothetical protein